MVIPLHNGAAWIEATLGSMDAQTVRPTEVVVVDDGSTDGGGKLVESFRFSDGSAVKTIRHDKPLGIAMSRNHGASVAHGEWLGFCDHDDLWHPRRIERIGQAAAEYPARGAIATEAMGFALEGDRPRLESRLRGQMVDHWVSDDELGTLVSLVPSCEGGYRELRFEDFQQDTGVPTATICFSRDLFGLIGGYPTWNNATGDWLLHSAAAVLAPILVIRESMVFYRIRPASESDDDSRLAQGALTAILALRLGDLPDDRPVGPIYHHLVRSGAAAGLSLPEVLGFALLGRFGIAETAGLMKTMINSRRK